MARLSVGVLKQLKGYREHIEVQVSSGAAQQIVPEIFDVRHQGHKYLLTKA